MIPLELPPAAVWFIRYLTDRLPAYKPGVQVVGEIPSTRPASFVQVTNAGGADITRVTAGARLMVDSWDVDNRSAERLSARVHALARAAPGVTIQGVKCRSFEAAGLPVDMPDPDSPRYRQNIILSFRAQPLQEQP